MFRLSVYRLAFLGFVVAVPGSCSKKLNGPTPSVSGVTPLAVCPAQLTQTVQLAGTELAPLYTRALDKGQLELPKISLTLSQDLASAPVAGTPVFIPDDPTNPAASRVRWTSQMAMSFDVFPELMLMPGLYVVNATNANDKTGVRMDTNLLVAPPPVVTAPSADILCGAKENQVVLTGDFFIQKTGAAPTADTAPSVSFADAATGTPVAGKVLQGVGTTCTPLPGPAGLEKCTQLTVTIPASFLAIGEYAIVVTNPAPVGCNASSKGSATRPFTLTIVPEPVVVKAEPDAICTADAAVSVTITGTGFLTINNVPPTVVLASTAGNVTPASVVAATCTAVTGMPGPMAAVQTCTTLTITVPMSSAGGVYGVIVTNPAPADCPSADTVKLAVFERPKITSVEPGSICTSSGKTNVVITGTGFVTVAGTAPTVKVGTQTIPATAAMCQAVAGPLAVTQVCTQLTIEVDPTKFTLGQHDLVVSNPTPVGCGSTDVSKLEIAAPPTITAFSPSSVCQGSATVTLTGTNFTNNTTVKIGDVAAVKVTASNNGTKLVAEFAGGLALGQHNLSASNGAGCTVTAAAKIGVIAGPQIFFVDPEIAYNKINVQATIYGTGFTGAVNSVNLVMGATRIPLTPVPVAGHPNQVQVTIPVNTAPGQYAVELKDQTNCAANLPNGVTVTDQKTLILATPPAEPPFAWTAENTGITIAAANVANNDFVQVPRVYLNPTVPAQNTVATALGAVAFVNSKELSAIVPKGLPPGKYDIIVVNPDGKVGVAEGGPFEVTADPPPEITTLSPGTVSNTNPQSFTVIGRNFRSPTVTLACVDSAQAPLATNPTATVSMPMATSLVVTFNASVAGVACVVRVTNGDNKTYDDFSALVITNPAQNLTAAKAGPNLVTGRRAPVALGGDASNAARFLNVIGGDNGTPVAFDTVETSALTLLGVPDAFFVQKNKLTVARAFAGGALLGRFLYVAGGSNGVTRHSSVERAAVLDPEDRGEVVDLQFEVVDQGLGEGIIYYRVAPVMKANDAFNPGGENLPSDPFPVRVPSLPGNKKLHITVVWAADADAAKYRVYRSPAPAAPVGTEQLIGEVAAGMTSFIDTGAAPIATATPYPVGSLGAWHPLPNLSVAREGPGVAMGIDPTDATKAYLYVLGGRADANTALNTYEFLPITLNGDGSQTAAGAWVAGAQNLGMPGRWQLGAAAGTNRLSPRIPAGTTFVYALGGMSAAGVAQSNAQAASIAAGGMLSAFVDVNGASGLAGAVAGAPAIVAANFAFVFGGGNAMPDNKIPGGEICATGVTGCAASVAPTVRNFNAGQTMMIPRYLQGGTLSGAFIYMAGGVTTNNVVTQTIEFRIW